MTTRTTVSSITTEDGSLLSSTVTALGITWVGVSRYAIAPTSTPVGSFIGTLATKYVATPDDTSGTGQVVLIGTRAFFL